MQEKEIQILKYALRPYMVFSALVFFILSLALIPLIMMVDGDWNPERFNVWLLAMGLSFLVCLLLFLILSRKLLFDLINKEKEICCFPITKKDWSVDYIAGSGIPNRLNGEMTPFNAFYIFCNGHSYRVDELFYSIVDIGDSIYFSFAKRSKTRFSMYVIMENSQIFNKIELF